MGKRMNWARVQRDSKTYGSGNLKAGIARHKRTFHDERGDRSACLKSASQAPYYVCKFCGESWVSGA